MSILLHNGGPFCEENTHLIPNRYIHCMVKTEISMFKHLFFVNGNLSPLPGIGLVLTELFRAGVSDDTLIVYTSDNGIPFPSGRTNLWDPGMREPFVISSPFNPTSWGKVTKAVISITSLHKVLLVC